jgi:uncharacterized protein YecE (DUF72 family)
VAVGKVSSRLLSDSLVIVLSMADTVDEDKRLRARLAAELGYFPATLDPEDIERHRRLNAALDTAPTPERLALRYRHVSEERRQRDAEQRGREEVADMFHGVVEERPQGRRVGRHRIISAESDAPSR